MRVCKLLLVVVSVSALLGASVTTATARNWEFSKQQMRKFFREVRFEGVFGATSCQLTLEGSVHSRTIPKVRETLMGFVRRATLGPCSAGTATILSETLAWHRRYQGFTGVLPSISEITINIIGFAVRIREPGGITCLGRSTEEQPVKLRPRLVTGTVTGVTLSGTIATGSECFGGSGTITSDVGRVDDGAGGVVIARLI